MIFTSWTKKLRRPKFRTGMRVKISEGSGWVSGKIGTIVSWSEVAFRPDGSGIPQMLGYYNVPDRNNESPVRLDSGVLILMFHSRLTLVNE